MEVMKAGCIKVANWRVDVGHVLKSALISNTLYFDLQLSGSPLCLRGSEASQEAELCHLLTPKLQPQILPALKSKT